MAFLPNDGDIIIDAVLTDTGRLRLAKGEFKISKFALGDDEIDYSLYNKDHANGSAFYDLDILQTPIFEAFTNNSSFLKSKLLSISNSRLLYLPILKLNTLASHPAQLHDSGTFMVTADKATEDSIGKNPTVGVIFGSGQNAQVSNHIRIDQGLDSDGNPPPETPLSADLIETQYIIELDNRLGQIVNLEGKPAQLSFIDDDDIASYFLGTSNSDFIQKITNNDTDGADSILTGPRGTKLEFKIRSSTELRASSFLFEQLGPTGTITVDSVVVSYIDAIVKVTGVTTGYRLDVPVRFIKE